MSRAFYLKLIFIFFAGAFIHAAMAQVDVSTIQAATTPQCTKTPDLQTAVLSNSGDDLALYGQYQQLLGNGTGCLGAIDAVAKANKDNMDTTLFQNIENKIDAFYVKIFSMSAGGVKNIAPPTPDAQGVATLGIRG